jgi:hypothetical protein
VIRVQPIELREDRRRRMAQVIDTQLLDARVVQQLLFERIDQPHAAHDHMRVGERWIQMRVEAHALQRPAGCDRDRHAAERSAARRLLGC